MAEGPIIYFEEVGVYNSVPQVLHIELKAGVSSAVSPKEIKAEYVSVAHLRGNIMAFRLLQAAIDTAIEAHDKGLEEKAEQQSANKPN